MAALLSDRIETHSLSQESIAEHMQVGLDDFTDEQISEQITELVRFNQVLAIENQIFDKFFKKQEPFINIQTGGTTSNSLSTTPSGSVHDVPSSSQGRLNRRRSKSRSIAGDFRMRLTAEQKCDIATKEIEELRAEMKKMDEDAEKDLDTQRAILEEADVRFNEIKKDLYEFERDIYKGAVNQKTKKVISERLFKYLDDKLKEQDTAIEKMRLKNTSMKKQKHALIKQLRQKEELGEVLLEVDFKQLKIENKQYLEKIEEKNTEMTKLKKMVGVVTQMLNYKKKQLNQYTKEYETIKDEIRTRQSIMEKLTAEAEVVDKEHGKEERKNRQLRDQLENYTVPEVKDYVTSESESYGLQKELKVWERKVEIAEMAFKINKQTWIQLKTNKLDSYLADPNIKEAIRASMTTSKQANYAKQQPQLPVVH